MSKAALVGSLAAGLIAAGASAEIVHFTNPAPGQPGHYDWHFSELGDPHYLDITLPPGAQSNTAGPDAVAQNRIAFDFGDIIDDTGIVSGHQASATPVADVLAASSLFTAALLHGQSVGAGPEGAWSDRSRHVSVSFGSPITSEFPEGQRRYIGVRIRGDRHGWIEVERTSMLNLTAHAWAYQTEPGAAILAGQIPAPGAAALLGLGAFGFVIRRRRP